jgi:hypothetical protein
MLAAMLSAQGDGKGLGLLGKRLQSTAAARMS